MKRLLFILFLIVPLVAYADIECDGVDDQLTTGLAMNQFIVHTAHTIMAWVKLQSTPSSTTWCYDNRNFTGDSTNGNVMIGRLNSTTLCAFAFDTADHQVTATSSTGWYHLALRSTGGTLAIFLNGTLINSMSIGALASITGLMTMCDVYSSGAPIADRMTDVQYYIVGLSDAEIKNLGSNRLRGPILTAPTGYYPLTDCADGTSGGGVVFKDRAGSARNATGANGGNGTGITCRASEWISYPMDVQ